MKAWLFKLIGIKEEYVPSYLNFLCIKWDQIPNPTTEKREVGKVPITYQRLTATHWPGWLILKWLYPKLDTGGGKALLSKKRSLELYPMPRLPS